MQESNEQSIRSRLNNSYHKLSKSHLVMRQDTTEDSLEFFKRYLNAALPENEQELAQVKVIKDLYHNSPNLTYRVLTAEKDGVAKQSAYVLWTNSWCITKHFNIEKLVRLEWDPQSTSYNVGLAQRRPEMPSAMPATDWKPVERSSYKLRKGKKRERRDPTVKTLPADPVTLPATVSVAVPIAIADLGEWD